MQNPGNELTVKMMEMQLTNYLISGVSTTWLNPIQQKVYSLTPKPMAWHCQ
jgi:hypothetical protein